MWRMGPWGNGAKRRENTVGANVGKGVGTKGKRSRGKCVLGATVRGWETKKRGNGGLCGVGGGGDRGGKGDGGKGE
jgi:hypothetical protein